MTKLSTPWGAADQVDTIAPGIVSVSTPSHGGIILDAAHVARIPKSINAGYSGTRSAWEEDADWAVPFLLFENEFANWECVKRMGAEEMRRIARASISYRPEWIESIDIALHNRANQEAHFRG